MLGTHREFLFFLIQPSRLNEKNKTERSPHHTIGCKCWSDAGFPACPFDKSRSSDQILLDRLLYTGRKSSGFCWTGRYSACVYQPLPVGQPPPLAFCFSDQGIKSTGERYCSWWGFAYNSVFSKKSETSLSPCSHCRGFKVAWLWNPTSLHDFITACIRLLEQKSMQVVLKSHQSSAGTFF